MCPKGYSRDCSSRLRSARGRVSEQYTYGLSNSCPINDGEITNMRSIVKGVLCLTAVSGLGLPVCLAQKWEFGVMGGAGFYSNGSVTGSTGSGDAGFKSGAALGAYLGNNLYSRLGGELRYEY